MVFSKKNVIMCCVLFFCPWKAFVGQYQNQKGFTIKILIFREKNLISNFGNSKVHVQCLPRDEKCRWDRWVMNSPNFADTRWQILHPNISHLNSAFIGGVGEAQMARATSVARWRWCEIAEFEAKRNHCWLSLFLHHHRTCTQEKARFLKTLCGKVKHA